VKQISFEFFLIAAKFSVGLISGGRLFQMSGPATENALRPDCVPVHFNTAARVVDNRSGDAVLLCHCHEMRRCPSDTPDNDNADSDAYNRSTRPLTTSASLHRTYRKPLPT